MDRTLVILVPGLSRELLGAIPAGSLLGELVAKSPVAALAGAWPAVTCVVQATLTTGRDPSAHGIIANGLATYRQGADLTDPANLVEYRRQVSFWEQSNALLDMPRFWNGKGIKTALLFVQNSMPGFGAAPGFGAGSPPNAAADIVVTPKPEHGPDGRIVSLLWSEPAGLAGSLQGELGMFPLMNYWGPGASIKSSEWICRAAAKVWRDEKPDLQITYVPHLDYDLQRFGPGSGEAVAAVAELAGALAPLLAAAQEDESRPARVIVISEYAMSEVHQAIAPNAALLDAGLLKLGMTAEGARIDYAGSDAWVMCDHQIGHVFTRQQTDVAEVRSILTGLGLEILLPRPISHIRAGDTQVQTAADAWLDYRWWTDTEDAPPWAKTVDIHRKPGYDPMELFGGEAPRTITQDASRIRGSHGRGDTSAGLIIAAGVPPMMRAEGVAAFILGA